MEKNLSLSYSKINTYLECQKKYYFQYILKLPTKPKYYFSFGETIHQILEFMYDPKHNIHSTIPKLDNLLSLLEENWIGDGFWDKTQESEAKIEARKLIADYYRKNIFSYSPAFLVEERFTFNIENIMISGKIDRIDKLPSVNNYVILDYKTGNDFCSNPETVDFIVKLQLIIYSLGFKEKYNYFASSVGWYFLRKNTKVNLVLDEEDYKNAINLVINIGNEIRKDKFNKSQGMKCQYCDFIENCNSSL
jgi:RecB family exonuclease